MARARCLVPIASHIALSFLQPPASAVTREWRLAAQSCPPWRCAGAGIARS